MRPDSAWMIRPRWNMLVSHHPPTQYDRTLSLGSVRVCARCAGVGVGLCAGFALLWFGWPSASNSATAAWTVGIVGAFVLSAGVAAFVLNETGKRSSSNAERIAFGVAMGSLVPMAWRAGTWPLPLLVALVATGQFASAWWLQRHGVLDRFFNEYLDGIMLPSNDEADFADTLPFGAPTLTDSASKCGRFFCRCTPGAG